MVKMIKIGQNGQKWSKMAKNYQQWSKLSKMVKMVRNGTDFLGSQSSHDVFRGQNLETMRHANKRFIFRSINQNVKRDFLPLAFDKFN